MIQNDKRLGKGYLPWALAYNPYLDLDYPGFHKPLPQYSANHQKDSDYRALIQKACDTSYLQQFFLEPVAPDNVTFKHHSRGIF